MPAIATPALVRAAWLIAATLNLGCQPRQDSASQASSSAVSAPSATTLTVAVSVASTPSAPGSNVAAPSPATPQRPAPELAPCPNDMVLVDGAFCPETEQRCLESHPEDSEHDEANQRCGRYAAPATCLSKERQLMRYCVDRYEWPNRAGEKPRVLTRWIDAVALCASVGKRLCSEPEWTFACEGEEMRPYTYGFERDPTRCVLDRLYVTPKGPLQYWDKCQQSAECLAAFAKIDQREPAGSFKACQSPFGVFDMNGNANEWVTVPGSDYPHRGGLKGGWWGPVRDRCRPTVRFHREDDWGYEIGLRCCKDSSP